MFSLCKKEIEPLFPLEKHPVYADTIGQHTCVKDRNGAKIFEGDIVDISQEEERGVIKWDEDTSRFIILSDGISADFDNTLPLTNRQPIKFKCSACCKNVRESILLEPLDAFRIVREYIKNGFSDTGDAILDQIAALSDRFE